MEIFKNPTKQRPRKGQPQPPEYAPPKEVSAWKELALIVQLIEAGVPYGDALHMSPVDANKLLALTSAMKIPPDEREEVEIIGTAADAKAVFGSF